MTEGFITGRRAGYLVAIVANGTLLWLINISPGWASWGFLTERTSDVLALVNTALIVGAVSNAVLLVRDTPLLRGLRAALTATFALVVLAQLFVRFPFNTSAGRVPLSIVLGLFMVVAFVGLVMGWSRVARALHVNAHLRRGPPA